MSKDVREDKAREILLHLAGQASVCWDKDHVFKSQEAIKFVEETIPKLNALYKPSPREIKGILRIVKAEPVVIDKDYAPDDDAFYLYQKGYLSKGKLCELLSEAIVKEL